MGEVGPGGEPPGHAARWREDGGAQRAHQADRRGAPPAERDEVLHHRQVATPAAGRFDQHALARDLRRGQLGETSRRRAQTTLRLPAPRVDERLPLARRGVAHLEERPPEREGARLPAVERRRVAGAIEPERKIAGGENAEDPPEIVVAHRGERRADQLGAPRHRRALDDSAEQLVHRPEQRAPDHGHLGGDLREANLGSDRQPLARGGAPERREDLRRTVGAPLGHERRQLLGDHREHEAVALAVERGAQERLDLAAQPAGEGDGRRGAHLGARVGLQEHPQALGITLGTGHRQPHVVARIDGREGEQLVGLADHPLPHEIDQPLAHEEVLVAARVSQSIVDARPGRRAIGRRQQRDPHRLHPAMLVARREHLAGAAEAVEVLAPLLAPGDAHQERACLGAPGPATGRARQVQQAIEVDVHPVDRAGLDGHRERHLGAQLLLRLETSRALGEGRLVHQPGAPLVQRAQVVAQGGAALHRQLEVPGDGRHRRIRGRRRLGQLAHQRLQLPPARGRDLQPLGREDHQLGDAATGEDRVRLLVLAAGEPLEQGHRARRPVDHVGDDHGPPPSVLPRQGTRSESCSGKSSSSEEKSRSPRCLLR